MNKLNYSYLMAKRIIEKNEKNYVTIICEDQFDEKDITKINEYPDRIFVKYKLKNDISFDFKELKTEDVIIYHIVICDIDIQNLEYYFINTLNKKNEYKLNDKLFKNVLDHFIIIQPNIGYVINEINNECSNSNNINLLKIKYLFNTYIYDKILRNKNYLFFNIYNIFNFPYLDLKTFIPQHKENINDISENNFTVSNISETLDDKISYFTLEYKYNENKINNIYEYDKYSTPRIGKYKLSTYFNLFRFIMDNNKFNDKKEFEIKNVDYECLLINILSNSEFDHIYFNFIYSFYRFDYDLVNTNIYLDTKIILYMIKDSNVKLLNQKSDNYITEYQFKIVDEN